MRTHHVRFKGALLERGFWVYVIRVGYRGEKLLYVGRTGDNRPLNAAAPFTRLARHLDSLPNAAADMLLRHLKEHDFEPCLCSYLLVAVGPLYPEQQNSRNHRRKLDRVTLIEAKLAQELETDCYEVVGHHHLPKGDVVLDRRYRRILRSIRAALNA